MNVLADIFLSAATIGAVFYCWTLSRRLRRFNDLETGVGGAVATLSREVDGMTAALGSAQTAAVASAGSLSDLTGRAEDAARRLELMVAAMHDLPATGSTPNDRGDAPDPLLLTDRLPPDPVAGPLEEEHGTLAEPEPTLWFRSRRGGAAR